jgi:hypothetical protein
MLPGVFSVVFNHAQKRVQTHPIPANIAGLQWRGPVWSETWIEPITETLILMPMSQSEDWYTTNSGIYAKPAFAAYEFNTSGKWSESEQYPGAGTFVSGADSAGEWARTVTAPGKNRGVQLAFVAYSSGDNAIIAEWGWHDTDTTVGGSTLGFRLYKSGAVEVWDDGVILAEGSIGSIPQNNVVDLMILPMRKREILVHRQGGEAGFVYVRDSISETDSSPAITPNEKFWFKMNAASTACMVQIAPLKFAGSGYATSEIITFARVPATGATLRAWANPVFTSVTSANLYGHGAYAGTTDVDDCYFTETDGSTAFVPDDVTDQVRMRIELSGDGNYTPFVYRSYMAFAGTTGMTNATEEAAPDNMLMSATLEVPDDAFGVKFTLEYKYVENEGDTATLLDAVPKLDIVSNQPVKVMFGDLVVIDGRTGRAHVEVDGHLECQRVRFDCRDETASMDSFIFRDDFVLDGYRLSRDTASGWSAAQELLNISGFDTAEMDLSDEAFLIAEIPGQKSSDIGFGAKVGESARRVFERLREEFAGDWFIGMKPTSTGPEFWFKNPADLDPVEVITLYPSVDLAISLGGYDPEVAIYYVYEDLQTDIEEVDANEVWASGFDPRQRKRVESWDADLASQDCTIAPSSRADNWIGEPRPFGISDPMLGTNEACTKAVEMLAGTVMSRRQVGGFRTPTMLFYDGDGLGTMIPVWRGDKVMLYGHGLVSINAFSASIGKSAEGVQVSEGSYSFGGFTNQGGLTFRDIQANNRDRNANRLRDFSFLPGLSSNIQAIRVKVP